MEYYLPEEDSKLMKKVLSKELKGKTYSNSLEIGVGSGFISLEVIKHSKAHLACDINPHAIKESKKQGINVIKSDLFNQITGKYDLIVFNPPYLPARKGDPDDWVTKAIVGGKKGYEIILRFIDKLGDYLTGDCYLLFSSLSKSSVIEKELDEKLFYFELKGKKLIMGEELFVYRIRKKKELVNLENSGAKEIQFFMKGKRGSIYTAKYKGKKVGIKILNNENAKHTIIKEGHNLKIVNSFGVGPKLIEIGENYIIYEFIEGTLLHKYFETADKKELKRIVLESLGICRKMDLNKFEKKEMTNPYKHIIVGDKISFVDFERGNKKEKAGNVSQFLQYLRKSKFAIYLEEKDVVFNNFIELGQKYQESQSEESYKAILEEINSKF